jgi:hypothetical protein
MTTEWVAYQDSVNGEVVLEVDETSIRVLSGRTVEPKQIHLSQLRVTPAGPDRKGRHQFELSSSGGAAARVSLFTDAAGAARIQVWLDAVARAQSVLRPPLV